VRRREQPLRSLLDEQDQGHEHQDLGQDRPGDRLEELVDDAQRHGGGEGAPEIADPAEDHDHEAVDDIALAEVRADIVDLRQGHAGDPGDGRAQAEGERVDPGGADAHRGRHPPVLGDGPHLQAEAALGDDQDDEGKDGEAKEDDHDARQREAEAGDDLDQAAHPARGRDLAVVGAEHRAHGLLQDQGEAPGGEQGLERAAVEAADDAALDQDADAARDQQGQRKGHQECVIEAGGPARAAELLHDIGRVGAQHHHLAVRHVDHAHHPEGDGEADGGQEEDRAQADALEQALDHAEEPLAALGRGHRRVKGGAELGRAVGRQGTLGAHELVQHIGRAVTAQDRGTFEAGLWRGALLEQESAAGPLEGAADGGVLLGRQCLLDGGECPGLGVDEDRVGGGQPLGGIGAHHGERAERGIEGAADAVVDPDRLGAAGLRGRAGGCLAHAAVGLLDQEDLVGTGQEPAVGHRLQHSGGTRVGGCRQHLDAGLDLLELGRGETGESLVEALGACGSTAQDQDEQRHEERQQPARSSHCIP
jgi:hypothetical protein